MYVNGYSPQPQAYAYAPTVRPAYTANPYGQSPYPPRPVSMPVRQPAYPPYMASPYGRTPQPVAPWGYPQQAPRPPFMSPSFPPGRPSFPPGRPPGFPSPGGPANLFGPPKKSKPKGPSLEELLAELAAEDEKASASKPEKKPEPEKKKKGGFWRTLLGLAVVAGVGILGFNWLFGGNDESEEEVNQGLSTLGEGSGKGAEKSS